MVIPWCPGDNFLANLTIPGGFSTRWLRFWGLFWCTSTSGCSGDNFVANHSWFWLYLGVFRRAEHSFEDYYGAPRLVDPQEKISSQVCSEVLTVPGGFSTRWARFWGIFRWTVTHWCPGNNFFANLSVPGRFFDPVITFSRTISVYLDTFMPRRRFRR